MGGKNNTDSNAAGIFKSTAKSFLDSVKFGSIFDPDLAEGKVTKTKEVGAKAVFDHLAGKSTMPKEDLENVKALAKYTGKI